MWPFVKDHNAKYVLANDNLATRCKIDSVNHLVGKGAEDIFHSELGQSYSSQDYLVMEKKISVINKLELHLYKSRFVGMVFNNQSSYF